MLEFLFQISLKKRLLHLFSSEFCEISKNIFFTSYRTPLLILKQPWRLSLLLLFYLSLTFLSPFCSQLAIGTLYSVSLFYKLTNFYDSCSYLSSLLFLLPKTEFVSSFALCSVLPFCRQSVVRLLLIEKCNVIFEAVLSPSERYQNIQDNPEYNSVLPFRIILKIFAVNMLTGGGIMVRNIESTIENCISSPKQ